jgi:hypothetical protein
VNLCNSKLKVLNFANAMPQDLKKASFVFKGVILIAKQINNTFFLMFAKNQRKNS